MASCRHAGDAGERNPRCVFARSSIVNYKQQLARGDRSPLWQRWFLDIVLLGIAGYGFYLFDQRQMLSLQTGLTTDQLERAAVFIFCTGVTRFLQWDCSSCGCSHGCCSCLTGWDEISAGAALLDACPAVRSSKAIIRS